MVNMKEKITTQFLLTIIGFGLIAAGSILVRYDPDAKVGIIAGILVAIGLGLLSFARLQ